MTARADLVGERIARHGLIDRHCATVAQAAALTGAIQAQDPAASRLGIRARSRTLTDADVHAAIAADRTVTRTWLMRGTIHLVDTADLRWLVRLVGPSLIRKYRTRWGQIGLGPKVLDATMALLPDVLAGPPLSRREVEAGLAERGLRLETDDAYAFTHVLLNASALGLVCRGPDRGRDATFTLLDTWVPAAPAGPSGDDALAELARRYFTAFSPATAADFTTWSGLAAGRAIDLVRDELAPADVDGRPGFRLGKVEPARGVRLLPAFDNYLIGYRDRDAILAAEARPRVYAGGMIRPAVLRDGRIVGSWALDRGRGRVTVTPFERLPRSVSRAVEAETGDIGRFLDRRLVLDLAASPD